MGGERQCRIWRAGKGADCTYKQTMSAAAILASLSTPCASALSSQLICSPKILCKRFLRLSTRKAFKIWGHECRNWQLCQMWRSRHQTSDRCVTKGKKEQIIANWCQRQKELVLHLLSVLYSRQNNTELDDVIACILASTYENHPLVPSPTDKFFAAFQWPKHPIQEPPTFPLINDTIHRST